MGIPRVGAHFYLFPFRLQAKVADDSEHGYHFSCPCCVRDLEDEDSLRLFQETLAALASDTSPLLKVDARHQETKAKYVEWKKIVVECMDDLRDYQRMNKEMNDTEKEHQRLSEDASHFQAKLRNQKSEKTDLQVSDEELRDIAELSKRWSEDAGRLAEKRMQIGQKELDLSASVTDSGRDLKTVEREMNEKMEEKDMLSNKINTLNREATKLNTLLANLSSSVSNSAILRCLPSLHQTLIICSFFTRLPLLTSLHERKSNASMKKVRAQNAK
jgi:DNA repair exonuclease SbcCD ATPase subunit